MPPHDPQRPLPESHYFSDAYAPRPPAPRSSGAKMLLTVLFLGLACCAFVVLGGVFIYIAAFRDSAGPIPPPQTAAELRAETARAFREFDAGDPQARRLAKRREHRAIDLLLDRLEVAAVTEDPAIAEEVVDFDRLMKRIEQTGGLAGWTALDRMGLKRQIRQSLDVEPHWARLTLAAAVPQGDSSDDFHVYALGWSDEDDQVEWRFWIARTEDAWKMYDWERLDLGLSEAEEWGASARYVDGDEMDGYYAWSNAATAATGLMEEDPEAAAAALRRAESQSFPPEVHDFCLVLTGYHWRHLGETEAAQRCFERVRNPDDAPGAWFGLMECLRYRDPAEALAYGEKYEAALGPSPLLCEVKASLLAQLDRSDEAMEEWWKVLRHDPDNGGAFHELLMHLPAGERPKLIARLDALPEPGAVVGEVAMSIGYRDYDALVFLTEYLEQRAPDSPRTSYLQGFAAEADGRYDEAAESYHEAVTREQDEQVRAGYVNNYLNAMASAGRVIEGYRAADDPDAAFAYFAAAYEDGDGLLTDEEYRELAALHRELRPEDPWGAYYAASLALEDEQYQEAEEMLRDALSRIEDDGVKDSLVYELAAALFHQGRALEAYETLPPREERFSQLGNLATYSERIGELPPLIEAHRAHHPNDAELAYFAGEVASHEKRWDDALADYRRAMNASEENYRYGYALRNAYVASGRWAEFYESQPDQDEAFAELASLFVSNRDWTALEELLARRRDTHPDDARIALYEAQMHGARGDDASFVEAAGAALPGGDEDDLPSWQRTQLRDQLLAALLRLERFDEARRLARERYEEDEDAAGLAAVAAATGDRDDALKYAREAARAADSATQLYWRREAGPTFLDEAFAPLHEEFPVELPYQVATLHGALLLDGAVSIDEGRIEQAALASGLDGAADVRTISNAARPETLAFSFPHDGAAIWIVAGEGTYLTPASREEESPFAQAVRESEGWLAVGVAAWGHDELPQAATLARKIGRRLAEEGVVGVFVPAQWRLYPADEDVLTAWSDGDALRPFQDRGAQPEESDELYGEPLDREFDRSLRDAARALDEDPQPLEILVHLGDAPLAEPAWLQVSRWRRSYGAFQFDGVLQTPSQLLPFLRAGLPMRIEQFEVQAWRRGEGPVTRRRS
jgi:tetratricopeptide (TPR) repeat protein